MFKIWAKIMHGDKIKNSYMYVCDNSYVHTDFFKYLVDICSAMDIPTPIALKPHKDRFAQFNITRFKPCDFVESVSFNSLVLEYVAADKK